MVNIKKLKFGSKFRHKGQLFFVEDVGKRVIRVRKIFDINRQFNPSGSLGNVVISIPIKELSRKKLKRRRKR